MFLHIAFVLYSGLCFVTGAITSNLIQFLLGILSAIIVYIIFLAIKKFFEKKTGFRDDEIEYFKTIVENLPDAVFIKDMNCRYVVGNNKFVELINTDGFEKVKGHTDFDIYPEKKATEFFSDDQLILRNKKESIIKEEEILKDSGTQYLIHQKKGIKNRKGKIIGLVCSISDITYQKQSSQELMRKNDELNKERNLLRALIDNVPDVIYIKDKELKFLDGSPEQIRVTKALTRNNLLGKTDYDFYPKDIADIFSSDDKVVIEKGDSIINKEEIGFDVDGNIRIISTTKVPYFDEAGNIAGLVGIGRDITKLKETEEKFKEQTQSLQEINILLEERQEEINQQSEELSAQNNILENERNMLRTLIDNIPDYIYIKDTKGAFKVANKHLMNNFNIALEDDILGKTDFDFFPENYARQYAEDEQRIIKDGKPIISKEEPGLNKDGQSIKILTTKVAYKSPDGEILGIVGIGRDITLLKEVELKLQDQADHLREVNVLLEERQEEIQQQSIELSSQNRILENERNLLRTLIDNIPDVIYVKDTDSRFITANKAAIELTGANSLENIIGHTDYDFYPKTLALKYHQDDKKIFEDKIAVYNKEEKITAPNNTFSYYAHTKVPFFDADKRILGIVGIARDITDAKIAHDQLSEQAENLQNANQMLEEKQAEIEKQSEYVREQNNILSTERNLMRTLIDNVPDFIYVKNTKSEFLLANKKIVEVLHIKNYEDILGKTDFDFMIYSSTAKSYYDDEQEIIRTGKAIVNKEEAGYDEEGRDRIMSTTKVPFYDLDGNLAGIVGIGRDITRQKNAEKQLREQTKNLQKVNTLLVERQERIQQQSEKLNIQAESLTKANKQLEQLNATKNKFFSIIAHDLKNPFQAIFGFSELLLRNYGDYDEKQHLELLTMIKTSSESAYNLLENLLQWARTQTDRIKYSPITFSPIQIIEQNIGLAKASADKKRIVLESEIETKNQIYADKNMINLVLRNLLSNAIKFTDFDGLVTIRCFDLSESYIAIAVTDTGIGMTPDNISKLFRIDQYFSTSGTAGEGGTGLGLIICREFSEMNKGELMVESEPEVGTTFTVTLPAISENSNKG